MLSESQIYNRTCLRAKDKCNEHEWLESPLQVIYDNSVFKRGDLTSSFLKEQYLVDNILTIVI